jgi:DNA-binding MarR family transcriptional regulator
MSIEESHQLAEQILELFPLVLRSTFAEVRKVVALNVDQSHFHLLWMLEHRSYTLSELAERRAVSLPTISNSIHVLEVRGWVQRVRSEEDRRKVAVQLTNAGQDILNNVRQHSVDRVAEIIANVPQADQEKISEALMILRDAFLNAAPWVNCPEEERVNPNNDDEGEN